MNHHDESAGFVIANEGYDVWFGNQRGNSYSRKHDQFDPDSWKNKESRAAFWDFSFNELAEIDLPTCIDFIKNKTGRSKMTFIGHSIGSTSMMYALAEPATQKHLSKSINLFIALAPVTKLEHMEASWPVRQLAWNWNWVKPVTDIFGYYEHAGLYFREFAKMVCALDDGALCIWLETWECTSDNSFEDPDRFQVYMGHTFRSIGMRTMYHIMQFYASASFRKYDYGKDTNV